jgi:hypothetical protein
MSERDLLTIRDIARPSRSRLNYGYGATADNGHGIFGDSALDDSETTASLTPPSSRDLFDQVLLLNTQNTGMYASPTSFFFHFSVCVAF